ncbi:MAG TPA: flagellar filament capping protein FliD [Bryobacteraceae bacterium]|jgi:flagellar hook-associated protein 2
MGTTPASFNGTSTYASDLQQEITHAVTIASLPLNALDANLSLLQSQSSELNTLQGDFGSLLTAVQSLDQANNGGSLTASVSDNTVATATLDSAAAISGGTYSLDVTKAGSPTTTLSSSTLPTVADPSVGSISSSSSFTLTVGTTPYTITPSADTLDALVQAINSSGASANATLVNIGSPSAPDYRLSVQSSALGAIGITLTDGPQDLLGTPTTGIPAQYQVNGQPTTPISSDSDTVTLAPGLTVNLLAPGNTTITVASNSSSAANALSSFAAAYNTASSELSTSRGTRGGALTGQSIIFSLEESLRNLTSYSGGSGSVQNLTDLGITFNQSGQLTFDQAQFSTVAATDPDAVAAFLGSAESGTGFLNAATNILNSLGNATNGVFEASESTTQQQITNDNAQIASVQAQVTQVQNQITAQMSAADSLIASLQSQSTYFTNYFTAEQEVQNSISIG